MVKVGLFVKLQAKPSKESAVKSFLESGLKLANQEATTPVWFALQLGSSTHTKPRWLCCQILLDKAIP